MSIVSFPLINTVKIITTRQNNQEETISQRRFLSSVLFTAIRYAYVSAAQEKEDIITPLTSNESESPPDNAQSHKNVMSIPPKTNKISRSTVFHILFINKE